MRVRTTLLLFLPAVVVAGASCAGGPTGDVTDGPADRDAVKLVATNEGEFSPRTLRLHDVVATVEFTNSDDQPHDFVVKGAGLRSGLVEPDQVVTARFTVPSDDRTFICTIHPDMKGTIAIDDKGAGS
jgi:plastocyanin